MTIHPFAKHIVIIGAGQLGVTFCLFLDRWLQAQLAGYPIRVTLIDEATEPLAGATRGSWIDHATGLEYFKRGEIKTAHACIEGSIVKHLLLPDGIHDLPVPIRNRFFVSAESNRTGTVVFDDFYFQAQRGAAYYRSIYDRTVAVYPDAAQKLTDPARFVTFLPRDEFKGVNGDTVSAGVRSAGGSSNVPMEVALKRSALRHAQRKELVRLLTGTTVKTIKETTNGVVITVKKENGETERLEAEYVFATAAHGISKVAALAHGRDLPGAYHLNFMLHAQLPPTADQVLIDHLSSVNFVLQGQHGGMYACIVPPTERHAGVAALFAPGYGGSYIDDYATKTDPLPLIEWDQLILSSAFPALRAKAESVMTRILRLNPFLKDYLHAATPVSDRVVVGSVYNPHGDVRSVRRMTPPRKLLPNQRILGMTSPKWTTVELSALTLLQYVLCKLLPNLKLPSVPNGFGPYNIDVASVVAELRISNVQFARDVAENYLDALGLPRRILPASHSSYA